MQRLPESRQFVKMMADQHAPLIARRHRPIKPAWMKSRTHNPPASWACHPRVRPLFSPTQ
jgi:hypothetical protein